MFVLTMIECNQIVQSKLVSYRPNDAIPSLFTWAGIKLVKNGVTGMVLECQ
jgi:hypothetical protein